MSREVQVRFCESRAVRSRPATHLIVCVNGQRQHAEAPREQVIAVLTPLGLRLSPEKTRVVHIDEGFDFLGFHIHRMRKRGTQKHYVYTVPSKKAIASIRDKVRTKTSRSTLHMGLDELLKSLNWALRGWANYFRYAVAKRLFGQLDSHAWRRIVTWIRRKHNRIGWKELRRRFCDRGWRIAHNKVVFTGASSVAVTRYRYRGHDIRTPWTPTPAISTS